MVDPAVAATCLIDPDAPDLSEQRFTASLEAHAAIDAETSKRPDPSDAACEEPNSFVALAPPGEQGADIGDSLPQDSSAWRQEIADRLVRYHARRKPRPPRYPSLRLRFEGEQLGRASDGAPESHSQAQVSSVSSCQALALDSFGERAGAQPQLATFQEPDSAGSIAALNTGQSPRHNVPDAAQPTTAQTTAKIIEFPRSSAAPPAPLDELAEPVLDRPRILEAPVLAPPPPALGGITIEGPQKQAVEKRPGIDIPLQSAPLFRRILAAAFDAMLVVAACVLFGLVFWKVAAVRPPDVQLLGLAAGLAGVFWAASQYLLIVYSGTTPGLLLARLELSCFDGTPVRRRLRGWRVLASFLSAVSLGMGYLWVFLDEDALCWHDRITHTYLAPKGRQAAQ